MNIPVKLVDCGREGCSSMKNQAINRIGKPVRIVATLVAVVLVLAASNFVQAELRNPEEYFFQQSFGDMSDELATAGEEGKKFLMIMFELSNCPWCERMKNEVLNRSEIQDFYNNSFRPLMMNVESDNLIVDLDGTEYTEKDYAVEVVQVRASPEFVFVDLDGNIAFRYSGVPKDANEFMLLGKYLSEGHYRTTEFVNFKQAN